MIAYLTTKSLSGVLELLEELGGSSAQLMKAAGVSKALFNGERELVPYTLVSQVIETAVKMSGRPDFALLLGRKRMNENYAKEIQVYALSSKTMREAVEGLIIHQRSRGLGIEYRLEVSRGIASISRTLPQSDALRYPQSTILWMACFYLLLLEASGYKLQLTSVYYTFKDPGLSAELRAFFRCPVQFDAEMTSLNFPQSQLELSISTHNDNLHDLLADYLKTQHIDTPIEFVDLVKHLIRKNLAAGRSDIEALTLRLPFQPRTIQKRLKQQGTSYSCLLAQVRFELAETLLLDSNIPITHISQRLCFQTVSTFTNAFKKEYGVSPRKWKQSNTSA